MLIKLYNSLEESIYESKKELTKFNFMRFLEEAKKAGTDLEDVDITYTLHRLNQSANLKIERIMLVEDELMQRQNAALLLARLGHYVETFASAEEAISFFKKDPARFSVVFTDHNMGQMSGSQLAKEVKKISPTISVYVMTGDIHSVDDDIFDSNVEATIQKPVATTGFEFSIGSAYGHLTVEIEEAA